jgi:hypothetical protein
MTKIVYFDCSSALDVSSVEAALFYETNFVDYPNHSLDNPHHPRRHEVAAS